MESWKAILEFCVLYTIFYMWFLSFNVLFMRFSYIMRDYIACCYELCHCLLNTLHICIQHLFILMGIIILFSCIDLGLMMLFSYRISLCSSNSPGTYSIDQASLEFTEIFIFASEVLGLKVCGITAQLDMESYCAAENRED